MDSLSRRHRSWNMQRISGRDTRPELIVRSVLHRLGYRFRLHVKSLPGRPDIALPRYHAIVFVHGCFWHQHRGCRFAYRPKSNITFWSEKFEQNVRRDSRNRKELRRLGWHVVVVWECQTTDRAALTRRLATKLKTIEEVPVRGAKRVRRT